VPKPALVTSGRAGPGVAVNTLARNAQGIFVFNADAPTPTQPTASTGYFRVSENPPHSPDTSFEPIVPAGGEKGMALFAAAGALPGLKVAVSEVDLSGVGPPVVVRAGVLGPADLAPFDAAKLPPAIEFASAAELPIEGGQGRLFDDELVIIGAPPDPQRGQGLNFVWYDLASRSIRARQTGAERLVPQRSGITAASITFARVPTGPTVDFDLVWIESSAGQSKLLYGELRCVRSQK
jgi:hypothetical protein